MDEIKANRMNTWEIPYIDQDVSFWDGIAEKFGDSIHSVYFPMPGEFVASGRAPQPQKFLGTFLQHVSLRKQVLINPILLNRPAEEMAPVLVKALQQLISEFGIAGVTVSNFTLAQIIRKALPDVKIAASTLMGIATPAQVLVAQECVDTIIPDTRVMRDLAALERLRRAFSGEIRLIVNEACLPGCLYRVQHFYEMAYSKCLPQSLCRPTLMAQPWLRLTSGWVLPQHLKIYDGLYDSLKLAGRVTLRDPQKYEQVLGAYIRRDALLPGDIGGGPASFLDAIEISEEWFAQVVRCSKECTRCTVCKDYYEKAIHPLG
jgi:hypothetical protein